MGTNSTTTAAVFLALLGSPCALTQTPELEPAEDQVRSPSAFFIVDPPVAIVGDVDPAFPAPYLRDEAIDELEFAARMESIQEYADTVEQIEAVGGAWDRSLAEELNALGLLQQQQAQHLEAIAALDRAVHINRVNDGLHTLAQIPIIESLIESYEILGNWGQADIYHNYLFYVQSKAYGNNDPRIISVLNSLAKWNVKAFNIGYGDALGVRLSSAQILFNAAARMVDIHFGSQDKRFVENMEGIASSAYLVSRNRELLEEINRPENRNAQEMLRDKLNELTPIVPRGYQSGEQALRVIVDHYAEEESATAELIEATSNLGDWYLLFSRRRDATEMYTQAWKLLDTIENGAELRQQMFGQVVSIPTFIDYASEFDKLRDLEEESNALSAGFADLSFDVTINGYVRNLSVLTEETEANADHLDRLRRQVRRAIYRPLIVDGRPVRANGNLFRYRYWH